MTVSLWWIVACDALVSWASFTGCRLLRALLLAAILATLASLFAHCAHPACQGHTVSVAYQTSGSIAVSDDDAVRFADFAAGFAQLVGLAPGAAQQLQAVYERIAGFVISEAPGGPDTAGAGHG